MYGAPAAQPRGLRGQIMQHGTTKQPFKVLYFFFNLMFLKDLWTRSNKNKAQVKITPQEEELWL